MKNDNNKQDALSFFQDGAQVHLKMQMFSKYHVVWLRIDEESSIRIQIETDQP